MRTSSRARLIYGYDGNGNPTSISDTSGANNKTMDYDGGNRLACDICRSGKLVMNAHSKKQSVLGLLLGRELSAVTFVRDYIQLHFDGPFINAYVWPSLRVETNVVRPGVPGYRDLLCARIGQSIGASEERLGDELILTFTDGIDLLISLKREDRQSIEAAVFQDGSGKVWNVW